MTSAVAAVMTGLCTVLVFSIILNGALVSMCLLLSIDPTKAANARRWLASLRERQRSDAA